jgi:hypothetical protein
MCKDARKLSFVSECNGYLQTYVSHRKVTSLSCSADKDLVQKLTILNSSEHQALTSQVDLKTEDKT